jgi:5-(carboxyamino)imidazole ribonucleotide mutase
MPMGIPVATVAIGNATNAGLLAVQMIGSFQPELLERVLVYRQGLREMVMEKQMRLDAIGYREYLEEK